MSAVKIVVGIVRGVCIGISWRLFDIPLLRPPAILGAVLATAMSATHTLSGRALSKRAAASRELLQSVAAPVATLDPGEGRP